MSGEWIGTCPTIGCDGDSRYSAPGRGHRDGCRHPSPTPVPSEVAETTAGEREVEALAEAIWNAMPAHHVGWRGLRGDSRDFYLGIAERLMPTLDRVRREEGERIAQAIENEADRLSAGGCNPRHQQGQTDECNACTAFDIATIARAASVGRGEGA